jgi:Flp pilus assembly protein TadD
MVRRRIRSLPTAAKALIAALAVVSAGAAITAVAAVPPNLNKAIESQRQLVTDHPQDPAALNDLGNLLLLADQPGQAEEAYRKALELDPNKVTALFNLALLQQQHGERREALSLYKKVVALQPGHAWAHYQLGTLYEGWGQESKAVEHYARAFALDPQLAFKEVNPHIVENKLVTQAMIRAYGESSLPQQVPQAFDEPGRIAKILVPAKPPADTAVAGGAADTTGQQAGQAGQPGQPGTAQQGGTVLRPDDLRGKPTGQALPQGGARMGRGSVRQQQPADTGFRQWERPEPNVVPQPRDPTSPHMIPGQPGQVITPPPGGVYYRPGSPSSGRLDIKVVPETEQRDARG